MPTVINGHRHSMLSPKLSCAYAAFGETFMVPSAVQFVHRHIAILHSTTVRKINQRGYYAPEHAPTVVQTYTQYHDTRGFCLVLRQRELTSSELDVCSGCNRCMRAAFSLLSVCRSSASMRWASLRHGFFKTLKSRTASSFKALISEELHHIKGGSSKGQSTQQFTRHVVHVLRLFA